MDSPNDTVLQRLNPSTPMAFLSPDEAYKATIAIYVVVGFGSAFIWDILNCLGEEYVLLFNYPLKAPMIAYLLSRLSSLGFVLVAMIHDTAPVGHCATFSSVTEWIYPIAISNTTLLFFFRVRAVFDQNRIVIAFFAFMWLAVLAGVLTPIGESYANNIGPTNYCLTTSPLHYYIAAAGILPLLNDTAVFLAITWKLMESSLVEPSIKNSLRTLAFGDYLLPFTRALFQDGQIYFLATVTTNLTATLMLRLDAVAPGARLMSAVTNLTIMNIMACRVYRNTKLNAARDTEVHTISVLHILSQTGSFRNMSKGAATRRASLCLPPSPFKTTELRSHASETASEKSRTSNEGIRFSGRDEVEHFERLDKNYRPNGHQISEV